MTNTRLKCFPISLEESFLESFSRNISPVKKKKNFIAQFINFVLARYLSPARLFKPLETSGVLKLYRNVGCLEKKIHQKKKTPTPQKKPQKNPPPNIFLLTEVLWELITSFHIPSEAEVLFMDLAGAHAYKIFLNSVSCKHIYGDTLIKIRWRLVEQDIWNSEH